MPEGYSPFKGHTTDIQNGDEFLFRGVTGEPAMGNASKHEIKVVGMTMWGDLIVKERTDDDPDFRGHGYQGHTRTVRYADAVLMLDQGIWIRRQDAPERASEDDDSTVEAYVDITNIVAEYNQKRDPHDAHDALMRIAAIIDKTEED